MPRILAFTSGPDDWKALLASEKHWRSGYSARTLAHCWEASDGFPAEIAEGIQANNRTFAGRSSTPSGRTRVQGASQEAVGLHKMICSF